MTHPQFRIDTLHQRSDELTSQLNRSRLVRNEPKRRKSADESITLRLSRSSSDPSIERLAALESRKAAKGAHLVAEVDGEVVAALSLARGEFLGDPFRPTAHLLPLMRRRAAQLFAAPRRRKPLDVFSHRFA
jgi:hypothetical protein